jgi:nicotinamidase-related amidase
MSVLPPIASKPYSWPFDGDLGRGNTALVVIDMQVDFCAPGGWVDQLGESIENTRRPIAVIAGLLAAARQAGVTVVHTREGHRPDLSDLNPNKRWRTRGHGLGIGDAGACGRVLTRGEPGHAIVPELGPASNEIVIDKPGKGGFYSTDLDRILRARGNRNLIITGVTTDCCVQATMREAADLGYECLLVSDATGAVEADNHLGMLAIFAAHGGRWGALAAAADVISAVDQAT